MKTGILALFCLCLMSFTIPSITRQVYAAEASVTFADFEGSWLADLDNSLNLAIVPEDYELYREFMIVIDTKNSTMTMSDGKELEETSTIENTKPGAGNTLEFNMDGRSLVMKQFGQDIVAIIEDKQIFMFKRIR